MKKFFPIIIVVIAFCSGAFFAYSTNFFVGPHLDRKILANCGVAGGASLTGEEVRIKCGLNEDAINALIRDALADLGIDDVRALDEDSQEMRDIASEFGLTVDALQQLLGQIGDEEATTPAPAIPVALEVAARPFVPSIPPTSQDNSNAIGRKVQSEVSVGPSDDTVIDEAEAIAIEANCGISAPGKIEIALIDVSCGPSTEEIVAIIDGLVEEAGVEDLQAAIVRDSEVRAKFTKDLGELLKLEDETVEKLLGELSAVEVSNGELRSKISGRLRERMTMALSVLRLRQVEDYLSVQRQAAAEAIVAVDYPRAQRNMRNAGSALRPVVDELSPIEQPPSVKAAELAVIAETESSENNYATASFFYLNAAQIVAGFPQLSRYYLSRAADFAAIAGRLNGAMDLENFAIERRLALSKLLGDDALSTGVAAANQIRTRGGAQIGTSLLNQAVSVLEELQPIAEASDSIPLRAEFERSLASTLYLLGERSFSDTPLKQGLEHAEKAVALAQEYGADDLLYSTLFIRGNTKSELGERRRVGSQLDEAISDYEQAAQLVNRQRDPVKWFSTQLNISVALGKKAVITDQNRDLSDAIAIYREIRRNIEADHPSGIWVTASLNLAGALRRTAREDRQSARLREAGAILEEVAKRSYEVAPDDWTEAMMQLADVWSDIAEIDKQPQHFASSIKYLDEIAAMLTPERDALKFVAVSRTRGDILFEWARATESAEQFDEAASAYEQAAQSVETEFAPGRSIDLHLLQVEALAEAAIKRSQSSPNFSQAKRALERAETILKERSAALQTSERTRVRSRVTELRRYFSQF